MVKQLFSFTLLLWGIVNCGTSQTPDGTEPVGRTFETSDGGIVQGGAWVIPDTVRGTSPSAILGVPTFSGVMNQDSEVVTQDALLGHFSVMWFYPFANTSG